MITPTNCYSPYCCLPPSAPSNSKTDQGDTDVSQLVHKMPPRNPAPHPDVVIDSGARDQFMECRRIQSALMPANFTTFAHFSVSSAMNFPNSTGVIGVGTAPSSAILAFNLGSARPILISLLSRSIISTGVSLGAPIPCHALAS